MFEFPMLCKSPKLTLSFLLALALSLSACREEHAPPGQSFGPAGYRSDVIYDEALKERIFLFNRALFGQTLVTWSTPYHTAAPVPIGAVGPDRLRSRLKGVIQNTEIYHAMRAAVEEGVSVILVIGDGLGPAQMSLPILMNAAQGKEEKTTFERILNEGTAGYVITHSFGELVTLSGCAATAMASGVKTLSGLIGYSPSGEKLSNIVDLAEEKGFATGVISDARITHATPAAFYAHIGNRNLENEIAGQLLENGPFEVVLGGGARHFIPSGTSVKDFPEFQAWPESINSPSSRQDDLNLVDGMLKKGYSFAATREELKKLPDNSGKVFGLFHASHLNYAIDRQREDTGEPSIVDMAEKGLKLLSAGSRPYLVMIEAGRIDHACHDNDIGTVVQSVYEMDRVLDTAYSFYQRAPEKTLLIFTGDHETGGLGLTYRVLDYKFRSRKLDSGIEWATKYDTISFENFRRILDQRISYDQLFHRGKTKEEFQRLCQQYLPFEVTEQDLEAVFSVEQRGE